MRPFIALILVMSLAFQAVLAGPRDIMGVEEVRVETPVGTLPRLPYRLRVTYSDGSSELRQVRWADEDPAREAGSEYRVNGYLSGDNSSPEGYPVSAFVRVVSNEWAVPSCKTAGAIRGGSQSFPREHDALPQSWHKRCRCKPGLWQGYQSMRGYPRWE